MEIKSYFQLIWRWSWLIILGALVAGGVAYIVSRNTTPVYRATSRLLIDEAPGSSNGNEYSQLLVEQRLAQTYIEIMTTYTVLEATIERLGMSQTVEKLNSKIDVSAPPDTQILVISAEDKNPTRAAEIANTLGEVFIEQNRERENLRYAEPNEKWQGRLTEIADEIELLEVDITNLGTPETAEGQARLSRLETQLNELQIRYTEAFNILNDLQLEQAKQSSNVIIIEAAKPPTNSIRPRTITNTILAIITGGLVAVGIILLIEYLDDTVKTQDQILEDTQLTTLGAISQIKIDDADDALITFKQPRDPISEAYRVLRTNLSFSAIDGELRTILSTSSSPGEGKSTTTANLAVVIAQTGKRVVIVDADLRRPVQHTIFRLPNNYGLTTAILDSESPVRNHLRETNIVGVQILTSGPIPPNPAELLNSQRMSHVIEELKQEADIILFDSPPVLTVTDASILAPSVDGTLIVVYAGTTRRDTFIEAVERLRKTNSPIFGVVLNRLSLNRKGYNQYYKYYENAQTKERKQRTVSSSFIKLPNWLTASNKR